MMLTASFFDNHELFLSSVNHTSNNLIQTESCGKREKRESTIKFQAPSDRRRLYEGCINSNSKNNINQPDKVIFILDLL